MKHNWRLDENGKPDEWAWESGFHNGVYCEDCGKRLCIYCDPDWFEMDDCPGTPKRKPQTNADRIRAMTDEELANVLTDYSNNGGWITEIGREICYERIIEWLKQPAED